MINIEESFNRTSAPKNDRPIKLQLQFKGADGIRVFGQKLDFFYKTLKQQFDQQTIKLSPTAVMCMRKTVCELIYQPPTSLETSTDHSHSGIIHKFSLAGCCTKSEVKGNDHYDQSALWMEVDLDDLHLTAQHLSKINLTRYPVGKNTNTTKTAATTRDQETPNGERIDQQSKRVGMIGKKQSFKLSLTRKRPSVDRNPPFMRLVLDDESNSLWIQCIPLKYAENVRKNNNFRTQGINQEFEHMNLNSQVSNFSFATTSLVDRDIMYYSNCFNFSLLKDAPFNFQFKDINGWKFLEDIKSFQSDVEISQDHKYQIVFGVHPNQIVIGTIGQAWEGKRWISKIPIELINVVTFSDKNKDFNDQEHQDNRAQNDEPKEPKNIQTYQPNIRRKSFVLKITTEKVEESSKYKTAFRSIILSAVQMRTIKSAFDQGNQNVKDKSIFMLHEKFASIIVPNGSQDFNVTMFEAVRDVEDDSVCPKKHFSRQE